MFVSAPPAASSAAVGSASSADKIICIGVASIICIFVILSIIPIALGVGLGVGLRESASSDSTSRTTVSSRATASTVRSTIISATPSAAPSTTATIAAFTTASSTPSPTASLAASTTASTTTPITGSTTASTTNAGTTSCTCGCSPKNTSSILGRVINGVTATANSWPWMVFLSINRVYLCGGFLIDYQHVITAAHCVPNPRTDVVYVYAGLQKRSSATNDDRRLASAISAHPNYDSVTFDDDIAVLKLASNFTPSAKIGTCCLPASYPPLPTISQRALVMGWGRTIDGDASSASDELLEAIVQIQSSSATCTASSIKFCAGLGKTDTCQGDSGGPLLTNVNNQWTCTGVMSSGKGCRGFGSYTRVSAFRAFIDNAVQTL